MGSQSLASFIASLIGEQKLFRSDQALASAIGVAQSRINRLRRGELDTLNALSLLKLASITNTDPGYLLRLAGKDEWARELENLYEQPVRLPLPKRRIMERMLELPEPDQQALDRVLQCFFERARRQQK